MEQGTKTKIQETALDLFSQRGYNNVSIRDIGKIVGIKESTLYYHFKNKQEIYDVLLLEFRELTQNIQKSFHQELGKVAEIQKAAFIDAGLAFFFQYLLEDKVLKFLRMLMIDQYTNKEAAQLYQLLMFEDPLQHNIKVFEYLIHKKYFKPENPVYLALHYFSPFFVLFQRYFAIGEVRDEIKSVVKQELCIHLNSFYDTYSMDR
jgi:AcrR family transcriptional regulator